MGVAAHHWLRQACSCRILFISSIDQLSRTTRGILSCASRRFCLEKKTKALCATQILASIHKTHQHDAHCSTLFTPFCCCCCFGRLLTRSLCPLRLPADRPPTRHRFPRKRACATIERSLTPNLVYGLPVWNQDIRWSLLGYALEPADGGGGGGGGVSVQKEGDNNENVRRAGSSSSSGSGVAGGSQESSLPSYLDWIEDELQVAPLCL